MKYWPRSVTTQLFISSSRPLAYLFLSVHSDVCRLICLIQSGRRCPCCAYVMCPGANHVSDPCQGPHPLKHPSGFCLGNWHWQVQLLSAFSWQPHLWHNPPVRPNRERRTHTQHIPGSPSVFPSPSLSSIICSRMVSNSQCIAGCCSCLKSQISQHELWLHNYPLYFTVAGSQ